MQSSTAVLFALLCTSCADPAPEPPPRSASDLPPPIQECGNWRRFACPGSYVSRPTPAPKIEHATSQMEAYDKGGQKIIDTLESSGFVVSQEYDDLGVIREVLVEDPTSSLAVQIELDSNGTIRQIDTLRIQRESKDLATLDSQGWRFVLDERGRVQGSESGVSFHARIVRSIVR